MGVQACRLPAPKRLKPIKPLKPLKHLKPLKPLKLCKRVSDRPTAPFARRSQPTGTPRPHQWLLLGIQACRLPAPKRLKTLKTLKTPKTPKTPKTLQTFKTLQKRLGTPNRAGKSYSQATSMRNARPRRQKLPQGQIHRFFWAVQPAVRQEYSLQTL